MSFIFSVYQEGQHELTTHFDTVQTHCSRRDSPGGRCDCGEELAGITGRYWMGWT